jgi:hypothetical protein
VLDWYDDNQGRAYPFLAGTTQAVDAPADSVTQLPHTTIEDFGCTVGLGGEFAIEHLVFLHTVSRQSGVLYFDFRSDAPGLEDFKLLFRRNETDGIHALEYVDATPLSSIDGCPDPARWQGFLVTGDLTSLLELLDDGETWTATDGQVAVEPRTITNLSKAFVRNISLANQTRTRATSPDGCPPLVWPTAEDYYVQARCLAGEARLLVGYNLALLTDRFNNRLTLAAKQAQGAGEPCQEVERYVGEVPPEDRTLLDGSLRCNEVLRNLAGLSGKTLAMVGGPGVSVSYEPGDHKIILDGDLAGLVR